MLNAHDSCRQNKLDTSRAYEGDSILDRDRIRKIVISLPPECDPLAMSRLLDCQICDPLAMSRLLDCQMCDPLAMSRLLDCQMCDLGDVKLYGNA